ncbi:hypothetical protein GOODEAATRI_015165 [Goodea atripinnis]|uniref:Uncharacterized protein n=1 Tax=Goodea atripinnis TaxID=208336 RepID=A0ABV0MHY8_9TELE
MLRSHPSPAPRHEKESNQARFLCFLLSLKSRFCGPGDELTEGSGFSSFGWNARAAFTEAEVLGRSEATGVVWRNQDDRGICHLGPMEGYLRGLECREHNRSYKGHGLRMLWSKATFDSSGGYGLGDAQYIYTLKFTHQQALPLLSARFTAHLETRVFSPRRNYFFSFVELLL